MTRIYFGSKPRRALWLVSGVVAAAACSRTADPVEHYASGAPVVTSTAGRSSGGTNSSGTGGKNSGGSSSGGKPTSTHAGSDATAGGSDSLGGDDPVASGGQGEAGAPPIEMPNDYGCGDAPVSTEPFTRRALRSAAAACAQWQYCRFEGGAHALADALTSHAAAPTPESLTAVTAAYSQALALLSVDELFQFGPLSSQSESAGKDNYQGQGFRELIYSWPLSARCRVEEQIALQTYAKDLKSVLVAGRGMFALDYLLYYPSSDTACSALSTTGKQWPSLSEQAIADGKLAYAKVLGDDIVTQTQALRRAWAPDAGNFAPLFVDATGYPNEQEAMKVLAWALLYVEREVKDWKLGIPTGHTVGAPVSVAEATFSGLKVEAIRQNLRGFRALFQGCGPEGEGLGFDDWLTEAGHAELAQAVLAAYVDAQTAADAAPELDAASPAELEALYQAVKKLTDLLKNDLFGAGSPLGLALPQGIEGDTD